MILKLVRNTEICIRLGNNSFSAICRIEFDFNQIKIPTIGQIIPTSFNLYNCLHTVNSLDVRFEFEITYFVLLLSDAHQKIRKRYSTLNDALNWN